MKKISLKLLIFLCSFSFCAQVQKIHVSQDIEGMKLMIDGNPTIINGMNWDYFPIGTNYSYSLWSQSDEFIKEALDAEMALLQNMGVNTIRMYTGVQPKWITYIYENYGIHTMLNHPFGRYGLTINGAWVPVTDYSNSDTKKILLAEVQQLALQYKNTKGLLLYLLGNENNYGLFWAGAETEDFPDEEKKRQVVGEKRGRPMYRLMNEASKIIKKVDSNRPVAICNGDLLFVDIVAEECKDIDIYGTNVYRGISFRDLARKEGCHPSTVLRQVRRCEGRRDDPLVDEVLRLLGTYLTSGPRPHSQKGPQDMTIHAHSHLETKINKTNGAVQNAPAVLADAEKLALA